MTILSLIGLLLSVGLWVASYLTIGYRGVRHSIWIDGGAVRCFYTYASKPGEELTLEEWKLSKSVEGWHCYGFGNYGTNWSPKFLRTTRLWFAQVPLWIPASVFAVYFLCLAPSYRRYRKRKKLGLCLKCGYDLRASKDRCPECGEGIDSTPSRPPKGSQNRSKSASCGDAR